MRPAWPEVGECLCYIELVLLLQDNGSAHGKPAIDWPCVTGPGSQVLTLKGGATTRPWDIAVRGLKDAGGSLGQILGNIANSVANNERSWGCRSAQQCIYPCQQACAAFEAPSWILHVALTFP